MTPGKLVQDATTPAPFDLSDWPAVPAGNAVTELDPLELRILFEARALIVADPQLNVPPVVILPELIRENFLRVVFSPKGIKRGNFPFKWEMLRLHNKV